MTAVWPSATRPTTGIEGTVGTDQAAGELPVSSTDEGRTSSARIVVESRPALACRGSLLDTDAENESDAARSRGVVDWLVDREPFPLFRVGSGFFRVLWGFGLWGGS